jgi:predicted Na+-dependent transporter
MPQALDLRRGVVLTSVLPVLTPQLVHQIKSRLSRWIKSISNRSDPWLALIKSIRLIPLIWSIWSIDHSAGSGSPVDCPKAWWLADHAASLKHNLEDFFPIPVLIRASNFPVPRQSIESLTHCIYLLFRVIMCRYSLHLVVRSYSGRSVLL